MLYDVSINNLPKTARRTISKLENAGITSIQHLLDIVPFRYEDYRLCIPISHIATHVPAVNDDENILFSKGKVSIVGTITKRSNIFTRRGFSMQKITLKDASGSTVLTWFNQPFLLTLLKDSMALAVSGSIKNVNNTVILQPESYEILNDEKNNNHAFIHTNAVIPIYSSVPGVSTRTLREKIFTTLNLYKDQIDEYLPHEILGEDTVSMRQAIYEVHFPKSYEALVRARNRISFNELFCIQLRTHLVKEQWKKNKLGTMMDSKQKNQVEKFITSLPFVLTSPQQHSIKEIIHDMSSQIPMNRLLQGDVGSGKTVVALSAALFSYFNDQKTLFMVPTEILAQQHYATITSLLKNLKSATPRLLLVTAASKVSQAHIDLADIIIGTHALLSSKRTFNNVGLVIVDEQHKFGVTQRGTLTNKSAQPHTLTLTATPIPRTVLLTLYGELDVSIIDVQPKGRKIIKTHYVPEAKRAAAYTWMKGELDRGNQIFIVCPFIEQSETDTLQSVKSARLEYEKIKDIFENFSVALLHGRLSSKEKDEIMTQFSNGTTNILVSTPVVEVGIDVPRATIIMIEGAERFGLAQLHQLRGRVGRSDLQSYCLLFSTNNNPAIEKRLTTFAKTHNGFELAKYDLQHRGGGNMFGTSQHGFSSIALDVLFNKELLSSSQKAVEKFITSEASYKENEYLLQKMSSYNLEGIVSN